MSILNHHTVAELRDWLAALDYQMGQVGAAATELGPTWHAQDSKAHDEWTVDWKALQARYGFARAKALGAIARAQLEIGVPDSMIPVEDEWQGVLHALSRAVGVTAKGDFQDLHDRLAHVANAQGKAIDLSRVPQPTARDIDLDAFKVADAAIRAGEAATRSVAPSKSTATLVVVGLGVVLGVVLATKSVLR